MKNLFTKVVGVCCSLIMISLLTTTNLNAQYCATASSNTSDDWLSNVTFAGIDNSSLSTTYSDFTGISGTVVPGSSYEFSGTIGLSGTWNQTIAVYIDWDQSMTFEPSERTQIGTFCNTNGCVLTANIDVPASAIPGETRMRVIEAYSTANTTPCQAPTYGEVEDYTINVQSGVCTPPSFTYSIINDCEAENYDVTALLSDFGTSSFITVYLTRSDAVPVNPVTLIFALQGQTVNLINDVPFGVTVSATISGSNPICNLTRNWAQLYCHIDGEVCDAPIEISELPFSASGNTSSYLNDYLGINVPPVAPNAITTGFLGNYYLDGDEVVYAYTPDEDGAIDITASNLATYSSLWVFTGCPFASTLGFHVDYPEGTRTIQHLPVLGGTTYYVVISTWGAITPTTAYNLSITPWEDCTGTPTAGTVGDDMMVCAATGFQLVSTGATADANGLIFTWQSSPVGANAWADVAGANTPSYNLAAGITADADFRLKAYCTATDATDYSDTFTVSLNPNYTECYCIPTYSSDCAVGDDLSNVTLIGESVSLNNTTECSEAGYGDFTSLPAVDLAPGETYSLSASTTYGSPTSEQVIAWIDFNLNGAFEADEVIATTAGLGLPSSGTGTFSFTMPEGLDAGYYRLRVRLVYGGGASYDACSLQSYGETQDYMVAVLDLDACSGTPEAGTAANDAISICPSIPFTLSVSGSSDPADGLVRGWQSSPTGANTWTNITGASSTNYTVAAGVTAPTDYRYKVVCTNGNASDVSNVVVVSFNPANECYCTPTYTYDCGSGDDLSNVTLTGESVGINNTTTCSVDGYADFTNLPAPDLAPGETYSLSASTTYGSPTSEQVIAWIDFNQNGGFEPEEIIVNTNGIGLPGGTGTFSFTMPEGLDAGNYRLRVRLVYGSALTFDACSLQSFGETQDYMVQVIELNACSGTPEAGTAVNTAIAICANLPFTVSVSGSSDPADGLTRSWQSSPAGANTWTDIAGATATSYTVVAGVSVPTDYRYRVVCANGNQSDVSNVIGVTLNPAIECYCIPTNSYSSDYFIAGVYTDGAVQDLDKTSGFTAGGYADYTSTDTLIAYAGQEFDFSMAFGSGSYQVGGWIDFNKNGSFGDPGEQFINITSYVTSLNGTILIPEGLADGSYRMRLRADYIYTPTACGDSDYAEAEDYVIKIITLDECAGTPNGGTVVDDSFMICPTASFALMVTGASSPANGLVRNWQSSPAGANTWSDIVDASNPIYTVQGGISVATDFRYRVTCTNSSETAYSNVVEATINTNVTDCYCIPTGTNAGYYINNFSTTNGISNISNLASGFSAGGYGDFTSMTVSQVQTQSVNFSEDFVGGTAGFRIWVDWNQDGAFDPVTELAYNSNSYASSQSGSFTVPQSALAGTTRMRVVVHYLSQTGDVLPCATFTYGEFEDYTFNVIQLGTCTGTPSAGVADNDQVMICATAPLTLSVTGASDPATGLVRNWQSSPAGANTWTNITGATASTYILSGGISVATDFRYVVTCENSSETAYSNVIEATINTNVTECYCIPAGTVSSYYVNSFATTNGIQNITNTGSGFSAGGYGDFTSMTVEQATGETVNFSGTFVGGTAGFRIWVDWNQDGAFDQVNEVVYNTSSYSTTWSGSFIVPANALPGTTRMRIEGDWSLSAGFTDPCGSTSYGEFEDYTFVVSSASAVSLNGSVNWNSSCGDRAGTVKLYTPNTATLLETYNITVGATGAFSIENLPTGTYDVIVKVQGYLAKGIQDVVISAGVNTLAVGSIRNGNVNNDNSINLFDLSLINAGFNRSVGHPSYNPLADLNCDGSINLFDISIFNASFNKVGATAPL